MDTAHSSPQGLDSGEAGEAGGAWEVLASGTKFKPAPHSDQEKYYLDGVFIKHQNEYKNPLDEQNIKILNKHGISSNVTAIPHLC